MAGVGQGEVLPVVHQLAGLAGRGALGRDEQRGDDRRFARRGGDAGEGRVRERGASAVGGDRQVGGGAGLPVVQVQPPTAEVALDVLHLVQGVPGVVEHRGVPVADVAVDDPALGGGGRGEQVVRAGVGGGGPGGEVGQPAAGLPVQVAVALVVEPDVDDRVVDVGGQRHRVDVRGALVARRQRSGDRPLTVDRAGQQRRQVRVVPEPEQPAGPGLVVELGGGQETTGRQRADRGLGGLRVQGAAEHPVQQVRAGGQIHPVAGVVDAEVAARRIRDDLDRVHRVARAVFHGVAVAGGAHHVAEKRLNAEIGRHFDDSADRRTMTPQLF